MGTCCSPFLSRVPHYNDIIQATDCSCHVVTLANEIKRSSELDANVTLTHSTTKESNGIYHKKAMHAQRLSVLLLRNAHTLGSESRLTTRQISLCCGAFWRRRRRPVENHGAYPGQLVRRAGGARLGRLVPVDLVRAGEGPGAARDARRRGGGPGSARSGGVDDVLDNAVKNALMGSHLRDNCGSKESSISKT